MNKPISLTVLASHVLKDRMMHCADLFERWKVLVEQPIRIGGLIKDGETVESCIAKTKKAIESTGEYKVVAIFHPHIKDGAWCDRAIIQISFGAQFCKFADWLKSESYFGDMPARYLEELPKTG